eukprot:5981856-Pyramimonas_sp.AAC.1
MAHPVSSTTEQSQRETLIPLSFYPVSQRKDFIGRQPACMRCRDAAVEWDQPFPVDTASAAGSATPACVSPCST